MKKIIFTAIILISLLLTACGNSKDDISYSSTSSEVIMNEAYFSGEMPEQITEDDLLNNKAEISRENNIIVVTGNIVYFEIEDENDAFRAVASLAGFMKIRDFNN